MDLWNTYSRNVFVISVLFVILTIMFFSQLWPFNKGLLQMIGDAWIVEDAYPVNSLSLFIQFTRVMFVMHVMCVVLICLRAYFVGFQHWQNF